jgi:hypothetical protein
MSGGGTCGALNAVRVQERALRCKRGTCGGGRDGGVQQSVVLGVAAQEVDGPADEAKGLEVLDARETIGIFCWDWMHLYTAFIVVA